jgi:hypothetical protein
MASTTPHCLLFQGFTHQGLLLGCLSVMHSIKFIMPSVVGPICIRKRRGSHLLRQYYARPNFEHRQRSMGRRTVDYLWPASRDHYGSSSSILHALFQSLKSQQQHSTIYRTGRCLEMIRHVKRTPVIFVWMKTSDLLLQFSGPNAVYAVTFLRIVVTQEFSYDRAKSPLQL